MRSRKANTNINEEITLDNGLDEHENVGDSNFIGELGHNEDDYDTMLNDKLKNLKGELKSEYTKEAAKTNFEIISKGKWSLHNIGKIIGVSIGTLGNVVLLSPYPALTYFLAGTSCIWPALTDFENNYKLIKEEILKESAIRDGSRWEEFQKIRPYIKPGIIAIGVGAGSIIGHIILDNSGQTTAASAILGIGTFIASSAQMAVNPMVRREVAKRKLKSIEIEKDLDILYLIENGISVSGEEVEIEDEREKGSIFDKIKSLAIRAENKYNALKEQTVKVNESFGLLKALGKKLFDDKAKLESENKELLMKIEQLEDGAVKQTLDFEKDKKDSREQYEKEIQSKNLEIQTLTYRHKKELLNMQNKSDSQEATITTEKGESSKVDKYLKNKNRDTQIDIGY